jgi:hypothetical protein
VVSPKTLHHRLQAAIPPGFSDAYVIPGDHVLKEISAALEEIHG